MEIEEALVRRITAFDTSASDRIYPLVMPRGSALPAVVYRTLSAERVMAHDGPAGLVRARMALHLWGRNYAAGRALTIEVRQALEGFRGLLGGEGGVRVNGCLIEDETAAIQANTGWYRGVLRIAIWYDEQGSAAS